MTPIERMAYDAGFRQDGDAFTSSVDVGPGNAFGMDIVTAPLMPDGFMAIRTEKGAMVIGPNGAIWVPFGIPTYGHNA
jgi:hypothetical protein